MPKQEFPFPMPNGWFCIVRSHELENGEVKSIKFCEKDVAAFRTESEKLCLDAYCGYSRNQFGMKVAVDGETLFARNMEWRWNVMDHVQKLMKKVVFQKQKKLKCLIILWLKLMDLSGHGITYTKKNQMGGSSYRRI